MDMLLIKKTKQTISPSRAILVFNFVFKNWHNVDVKQKKWHNVLRVYKEYETVKRSVLNSYETRVVIGPFDPNDNLRIVKLEEEMINQMACINLKHSLFASSLAVSSSNTQNP